MAGLDDLWTASQSDPMTGAPVPSQYAQDKFGRIVDTLAERLRFLAEFPGRYAQAGVLDPEAAVQWAAPMALGMVGSPATPAGALGSSVRPYANVPNSLMGFRRNGPQAAFDATNYPHTQPVTVVLDKKNIFQDAVKGMNPDHAVERAYRNWPDAWAILTEQGK